MPLTLPPDPEPFVLLDDARPVASGRARLYRDPVGIVTARRPEDVRPALERLREAGRSGLHVAGYLAYEAGLALEPALAPLARTAGPDEPPLLWFGLFRDVAAFPAGDVPGLLPSPSLSGHGAAVPMSGEAEHAAALDRVLAYIRAGDIYQANVTLRATAPLTGDPLAAYAAIRPRAAMGHGALIRHDGRHILCFSPESFFALEDGQVEARPMKGTAPRRADPAEDVAEAMSLLADAKQRAENLMIVDLIRNDLSRVCLPGSVRVPDLFTVETYPTVHQMTSRVVGRLRGGLDAVDVIAALFPCGSITGAPKIRAMEIIAEVERKPRYLYTGSIGCIEPQGNARFNVAIRTVSLDKGCGEGMIGIGSGIVADSSPAGEWRECLEKARFLERPGT
ncbi:MAG: aminodeoxychorismate synthase component I [Sphingobium sp.]